MNNSYLTIYKLVFVVFVLTFMNGCKKEKNSNNSLVPLPVNDIDGNVYQTVTIGKQIWMIENLKTTKYNDGASISNVTLDSDWTTLTSGSYCWYENDTTNKNTYGALYNWYSVDTKKLCPIGWHVPSNSDWTILTDYLGGENIYGISVAGGKLKESGTAHWRSPNTGATNETGFTGLPGGYRYGIVDFSWLGIGEQGYWWSSSLDMIDKPNDAADYRAMSYYDDIVINGIEIKMVGFSVRCLKN